MTSKKSPSGNVGTRVMSEHPRAKIWELKLDPGESSEWHAHQHDYIFVVLEASTLRTEYDDGTVHDSPSRVGDVVYLDATTHRVTNVGKSRYRNVIIELL